jgi:hypothetical protein
MNFEIRISEKLIKEKLEIKKIFNDFKFQKTVWYQIGLTHLIDITNGELSHNFKLYVNGQLIQSLYQEISNNSFFNSLSNFLSKPSLNSVCLGSSSKIFNENYQNDYDENTEISNIYSSFQLGNFFLMNGIPTPEEFYMIYFLGPEFTFSFQDDENLNLFFPNEIMNEYSVTKFGKDIYDIKQNNNTINLQKVKDQIILFFKAKDSILCLKAKNEDEFKNKDDFQDSFSSLSGLETINFFLDKKNHSRFKFHTPIKYLNWSKICIFQTLLYGCTKSERSTLKSHLFSIGGISSILGIM